jgi:hypothetical protein
MSEPVSAVRLKLNKFKINITKVLKTSLANVASSFLQKTFLLAIVNILLFKNYPGLVSNFSSLAGSRSLGS